MLTGYRMDHHCLWHAAIGAENPRALPAPYAERPLNRASHLGKGTEGEALWKGRGGKGLGKGQRGKGQNSELFRDGDREGRDWERTERTHRGDAGVGELAGDDGGLVADLLVDELVALLGDDRLRTRSGQVRLDQTRLDRKCTEASPSVTPCQSGTGRTVRIRLTCVIRF